MLWLKVEKIVTFEKGTFSVFAVEPQRPIYLMALQSKIVDNAILLEIWV